MPSLPTLDCQIVTLSSKIALMYVRKTGFIQEENLGLQMIPPQTSADELEMNGSNYGNNWMMEGSFSELRVDVVETSRESEATAALALAKERELLVAEVMASLGPCGAGILAVRGVPEVPTLRKRLLPLARKLALMPDATRRPILKVA